MRKVILLLSFVSLFWACQKKEYPTFNYPNSAYLHQPKAESAVSVTEIPSPSANLTAPQPLSASANEGVVVMTENEVSLATIPVEAISSKTEKATITTTHTAAPEKLTWTQKVIAKKIQKQIKKADSPEKVQKSKAAKKEDTMSLLALIFGGSGLIFLFAINSVLGLLLGIAGLVLGIMGMQRVKRGEAPASSKILALLGLILGGVVSLIGLLAVANYYGN